MMAATERAFIGPLLVLEVGSRISSGAAGGLLAQLGAEVVVVEPGTQAVTNKWLHRPQMMAGKKSVVLDWKQPNDRTKISALMDVADVVLLSSDIDGWQKEFWDGNKNPTSILCDITAFGHSGPLAGEPLPEGLIEALCGIVDTTGQPNETPSAIGTPLLEMHAALYAASMVVAAHRARRRGGASQKIEVALFDVGATSLINFLPFIMAGKNATRFGNRHPLYAPWNLYEAADGSLLICAVTDQQWQTICKVMAKPELAKEPRFATAGARLENRSELDAVVSAWTKTKSVRACEQLLLGVGIACGPVLQISDVPSDPNVLHRHSIVNVEPNLMVPASPLRATPVSGRSPTAIPDRDEDADFVEEILRRQKSRPRAAAPVSQPKQSQELPYDDIRIIEVGQYTVAPMAARIMGALGADVIKVESPLGDATRSGGLFRSDGASYIFALSNTDKRGIVLDLQQEGDRELLHRLLDTADALIENLKPGSLAKLGFSSEALRERHPHLIYCSISGFGADSAYLGRPALDTVIQAMSGLMDITRPGGIASKAGISASDNLGGQFALLSLCAAIELRDREGIASHFDLSMQDATIWATQLELTTGTEGERRPTFFRAADGYVAVQAEEGETSLLSADMDAALDRAGMVKNLQATCAAAPVLTVGEVIKHPQFLARNLLVECQTLNGDKWEVFSLPFKMLGSSAAVKRVMGRLRETDEQIHSEIDRHVRSLSGARRGKR